jgi:hypothetical protein
MPMNGWFALGSISCVASGPSATGAQAGLVVLALVPVPGANSMVFSNEDTGNSNRLLEINRLLVNYEP